MSAFPRLSPAKDRLPSAEVESDGRSLWQEAWRRLRQNRLAMVSLVLLTLIVLFCVSGALFSPYSYTEQTIQSETDLTNQPPLLQHWMGTDGLGRDLLVRVAFGGLVSLTVGIVATLVSLIIGVTYGAIAGFQGGKTGGIMMRLVDILYALPFTILVILLMTLFERNFLLLFLAIGLVEWLTMARIVFGQVNSLKRQEFIEAAVSLGLRNRTIIFRHLLPNVLGVVVVYATLTVPAVILLESFLSFLGLGVPPPVPSWGSLIKGGTDNMQLYPYQLIIPAVFFSVTLFCLNFLGDGLRDALDPQSSRD